ncbi:hypothetical protein V9T40_011876 [Parthenolecanium corni]|uniref:ARHGAP20 PH domain-containing protein n=1 Tax=Parthenolecanium corni TaxID=536013 RepID=A0AAN9T8K4_9HEMI
MTETFAQLNKEADKSLLENYEEYSKRVPIMTETYAQAAKRGQRESDLERIQDLFPNDCLRLYDADALTMKVKGLMRKRSGAAARLQRALSTKSLRSESPPSQKTPLSTFEQRTFLMEAPVQFSTGVQSQDRHLFLFNDLLLVAKPRSGGNFKLKEKVRISEIWLTKCCFDEVTELIKSQDTSFVMGWPTTNVVVTFSFHQPFIHIFRLIKTKSSFLDKLV